MQWVLSDANYNYAAIKNIKASPHCWRGITEPGETCLATSVNGNHPTETPNPARNH